MPSCQVVQSAFVAANVAVSSVVDNTVDVQQAASDGTLPYKIERFCEVTVPGRAAKSQVQVVGPANAALLEAFRALGTGCMYLPAGSGDGDRAFVCPGPGSFYGLVGTLIVHIGPSFRISDVEHVAQDLILKMR